MRIFASRLHCSASPRTYGATLRAWRGPALACLLLLLPILLCNYEYRVTGALAWIQVVNKGLWGWEENCTKFSTLFPSKLEYTVL